MRDHDWTRFLGLKPDGLQQAIHDRLKAGEPADVHDGELSADFVRSICQNHDESLKGRIVLTRARVLGHVDLSGLFLKSGLSFRHCEFDAGVDLSGSVADETIEFSDCRIDGLVADDLVGRKDVEVVDCEVEGVRFARARFEKDLRLSRSQLTARPGCPALDGPDMVVEGGLYLDHVTATGGVVLDSSRVGQDLDCRGGQFHHPTGMALDATWVSVGRELRCDERFHADGEVRLCWARADLVSFRNATLHHPPGPALRADSLRVTTGCYLDQGLQVTGTVRLAGAQIAGELSCKGSHFDGRGAAAIEADRLSAKDVYLDHGFAASGVVRLVGARLERQLTCTGGHFDNPSGTALDATGLICDGSVYLDRDPAHEQAFSANGQVRLFGASVAEAVVCTGGLFSYRGGVALEADSLNTNGNVMLDGCRVLGGARLARATVGRQLDCRDGDFQAVGDVALDLTGLVGRGDVLLCGGFRATGEVRLRDAEVARDVDLTGGRFTDCGGTSIDAYGLHVGGSLTLLPAALPTSLVDLREARAERLHDGETSYPEHNVELEGFTYQSMEHGLTCEDRVRMLDRMRTWSRQPYQHLSGIYRKASDDEAERRVAVAGLWQLRKRDKLKPHAKAWNWFMWATVYYGYRLYQPLLIAVPFFLLNIAFFHTAEHHGLMEPTGGAPTDKSRTDATHCPPNYPCFNPTAYSFQLLIPAVNLYQLDKWVPDAAKPWGTPLLIWTFLMIAIGWVLGFSLVAAINGALRRR